MARDYIWRMLRSHFVENMSGKKEYIYMHGTLSYLLQYCYKFMYTGPHALIA